MPVAVLGRSATNSIQRGYLYGAIRDFTNDWISRAERFLIVSLNAVNELYERHPVQNNSHLHFVTTAAPVAAPAGVPA